MPKVSEFFGIAIYFFYNDHHPPHFHSYYGDAKAMVSIMELGLLQGHLPPRALGLVMEWASLHRQDLLRAWDQAKANAPIAPIPPLD